MTRNIPLGFLVAGGESDYLWASASIGGGAYNGGVYANLANGKFFGFENNNNAQTTSYRYSTNGTSWTNGTLPLSRKWGKAATNGSRVVVVATDVDSSAYTDNGTTWTSTSMPGASGFSDILWDGTRFLAVSVDTGSGNLSYSTDGATWTGIDIGSGFYGIGFNGATRYIAGPIASTSTARTTTSDPTVAGNWGNLTMPSTGTWISFIYGNGTWLANRADATSYATSTNGTTWTSRTLPGTFGNNDNSSRPLFFDGYFWIMVTVSSEAVLYRSTNAITWELVYNFGPVGTNLNPNLQNISGWAATEGTIIGFGNFSEFREITLEGEGIRGVKL